MLLDPGFHRGSEGGGGGCPLKTWPVRTGVAKGFGGLGAASDTQLFIYFVGHFLR